MVEGKGCRAGLFIIGREEVSDMPSDGTVMVKKNALTSMTDKVEIIPYGHRKEVKPEKSYGGNILREMKMTVTEIGRPRPYFEAVQ